MRAGHRVGQLVRGQRLVNLPVVERQADHGAEVADALAQVHGLVQEPGRSRAARREPAMAGMKPANIFTSSGSRPTRSAASHRAGLLSACSNQLFTCFLPL
ncbi:hypothetical protein [Streptomyces cyaneofuscatus]|uniref:hypothetical protein n=1 Tax=Streptomyces cyaneofuscatus TaxID=66883 RepID=UPI0033A27517